MNRACREAGVVNKNKRGGIRVVAEADVLPVDRGQIQLAGEPAIEPEDGVLVRVGDRLRGARERLGIGRAELSQRTKINERHLEALEDSDFTALPARIYAVGFARSYAGAVGLDAARIAAEVRRELSERENPPPRPVNQLHVDDPSKVPSGRIVWLSLALGTLLIAAGTLFWRSYFVPAVDLPPVREQTGLEAETAVPELSPQAQISPTAESAVPVPAPVPAPVLAPAVRGTVSAPVAQRVAPAPGTIAPTVQAVPPPVSAPVPDALEPAPPGVTAREPG